MANDSVCIYYADWWYLYVITSVRCYLLLFSIVMIRGSGDVSSTIRQNVFYIKFTVNQGQTMPQGTPAIDYQ